MNFKSEHRLGITWINSFSQVTASDADIDRPNNIIYFLTGPGIDPENPANSNFDINEATGEVFVLKVGVLRRIYVLLNIEKCFWIP